MYKLLTCNQDSSDLSLRFDESNQRQTEELTRKREAPEKGSFLPRNFIKDVFGNAEPQENGTYGSELKITINGKSDAFVKTPKLAPGLANEAA